jgi:dipeptidyl aminopeptidase/acylaminoacyl peptidase
LLVSVVGAIAAVGVGCGGSQQRSQEHASFDATLNRGSTDGWGWLAKAPVPDRGQDGIWLIDPTAPEPTLLLSEKSISAFTWSRQTQALLYVSERQDRASLRVAEMGAPQTGSRELDDAARIHFLRSSPAGPYVAYLRELGPRSTDPGSRGPAAELVVRELPAGTSETIEWPGYRIHWFAWSPDSASLAVSAMREGQWWLGRLYRDGRPPELLVSEPFSGLPDWWSPDGKLLAGGLVDRMATASDPQWTRIFIYDLGRRQYSLYGGLGETAGSPSWSPEGESLVFMSNRDGSWQLYVLDVAYGVERVLDGSEYEKWYPSWSPDGRQIAFKRRIHGRMELCTIRPDGSGFHVVPNQPGSLGATEWISLSVFAQDGK